MKIQFGKPVIAAVLGALSFTSAQAVSPGLPGPPVIPQPLALELSEGTAQVGSRPDVVCDATLAGSKSAFLDAVARLSLAHGFGTDTQGIPIELRVDGGLLPEAYELLVNPSGVRVVGGSQVGVAHALATLIQLMQPDGSGWSLPAMTIRDAPENSYRAVMVDVARKPHSIATLRAIVDLMWFYKLRFLQLHLTDDQSFAFPFEGVTDELSDNPTISIADWRAFNVYAADRGIAIIPELDLPGHSTKLKESGYLEDPTPEDPLTDSDVAHPVNHARIFAIVDAMLDVFDSSPYFHIGGDESGAGAALIPFLAAVNRHLRGRRGGARKRLLVWEGFRGAPDELPAEGEDRIVVVAWESAYNAPWDLLSAGYELVNASWKPLYVVGGGASERPPHHGGRRWSPRDILDWDKDEFWHWQAGTPVFEDRGPGDESIGDGRWRAPPEQREQILGGQMCFWEQHEHAVIPGALERIPALAESLWSGKAEQGFVGFERRLRALSEPKARVLAQPVRLRIESGVFAVAGHPTRDDMVWFDSKVQVALEVGSRPRGTLRYTLDETSVDATSSAYREPLELTERTLVRAAWFVDEEPLGAPTHLWFDNAPAKVRCAWFDLPRRALGYVPDFADGSRWTPARIDLLPELRGPYRTTHPVGQRLEGTLAVGAGRGGAYAFRLQTRDGRANLYLDDKLLLGPSKPSEERLTAEVELAEGLHGIRVDHAGGPISPVILVSVRTPEADDFVNVSELLLPIPRASEPQRVRALAQEIDLFSDGLAAWRFVGDVSSLDEVVRLEEGVLRITGKPAGYLETRRWYRDYVLQLEWRWPDEPGNSGVLVHNTVPQMFFGWPRSLEVQLQAGHAGDFWKIGDEVHVKVENAARRVRPEVPGKLHQHRRIPRLAGLNIERPLGSWNSMRIRCANREIVVDVNGVEVQRGCDLTVTEGAIALQSEGAPIEFRAARLRPLRDPLRAPRSD